MTEPASAIRPTHTRHVVLALIVGAYMITYMDRVNIASAVPVIQKDMGFSMVTIGWIFASFRWGYAFFQIPGGWLGDRIGGRRALAFVVVHFHVADRVRLERGFDGSVPVFLRRG
jgi:MFS family permease